MNKQEIKELDDLRYELNEQLSEVNKKLGRYDKPNSYSALDKVVTFLLGEGYTPVEDSALKYEKGGVVAFVCPHKCSKVTFSTDDLTINVALPGKEWGKDYAEEDVDVIVQRAMLASKVLI